MLPRREVHAKKRYSLKPNPDADSHSLGVGHELGVESHPEPDGSSTGHTPLVILCKLRHLI